MRTFGCCLCFSNKTGTFILGTLELSLWLVVLSIGNSSVLDSVFRNLSSIEPRGQYAGLVAYPTTVVNAIKGIGFTTYQILVLPSALLIIGAYKENYCLFYPWLIWHMLSIILGVILLSVNLIILLPFYYNSNNLLAFGILPIMMLIFYIYFWIVVYTHFIEVQETREFEKTKKKRKQQRQGKGGHPNSTNHQSVTVAMDIEEEAGTNSHKLRGLRGEQKQTGPIHQGMMPETSNKDGSDPGHEDGANAMPLPSAPAFEESVDMDAVRDVGQTNFSDDVTGYGGRNPDHNRQKQAGSTHQGKEVKTVNEGQNLTGTGKISYPDLSWATEPRDNAAYEMHM